MMQTRTRQEHYRAFIEFIRADVQGERKLVNRKMFNVFLWCFLIPAVASAALLLLVKFGILPRNVRQYLDWLALVFPVAYSLYILGSDVLAGVPAAFRQGGISNSLGQVLKESEWRERVCDGMRRTLEMPAEDWKWVIESYRVDLSSMRYRIKYLTGLAGAVFFLLMQGIDSLGDTEGKVAWTKVPGLGWVETTNDLSQFVGLALFLVLLYLSGNQTCQSLGRYLDCAELLKMD